MLNLKDQLFKIGFIDFLIKQIFILIIKNKMFVFIKLLLN